MHLGPSQTSDTIQLAQTRSMGILEVEVAIVEMVVVRKTAQVVEEGEMDQAGQVEMAEAAVGNEHMWLFLYDPG